MLNDKQIQGIDEAGCELRKWYLLQIENSKPDERKLRELCYTKLCAVRDLIAEVKRKGDFLPDGVGQIDIDAAMLANGATKQ